MNFNVLHTRALIARLRHIGPVRSRQPRLPRQEQPDAIRVEYFRALKPFVQQAWDCFNHGRVEIPRLLAEQRAEAGHKDAADESKQRSRQHRRALALVDEAAQIAADKFAPHAANAIARKFGQKTTDFQKQQIDKQTKAAISVSYNDIEKPVKEQVDGFAAINVDLIKTVPERMFDRIRLDVEDAFTSGSRAETLVDKWRVKDDDEMDDEDTDPSPYNMAENDARRIARDQIGKLNAAVNEERQKSLGLNGYVWRTMNDERVREEHQVLEGQEFTWDSPPPDGHPGDAVQCRCYAEPNFSGLLDDDDSDNDDSLI